MKKILVSFFSLIIALNSFATKHNHFDENEVRYIKENTVLNPQYQELLRNSDLWQDFRVNNPDWFVIFNEKNQLPHRAFGSPIPVNDLQSFLSTQNFMRPVALKHSVKFHHGSNTQLHHRYLLYSKVE